jgi:hypothetical protein
MYANPRKTTSIRPLGRVDISGIRDAILAIPESTWDAEDADKPNKFETLDKTRHIVFRFVDDHRDWRGSHDRPLWNQWRDLLLPVMEQATRSYGYARAAYPRVMLARMAPGGIIQPHVDTNPAAQWPHKIHVPILTNPRVGFLIGNTVHIFPEAEAVEVNNLTRHAVQNAGDTDRIHLIFEYYDLDQPDPDWIRGA